MSKTYYCIGILIYLSDNPERYKKLGEIACEFNISNRNAREYIERLRLIGFNIESRTGINGGYTNRSKGIMIEEIIINE
ncbi:MAG: Rrf2 family transcriptional regulator [Holdemanella sp.]|nr:Rrf2 family transcriptional regulator [Holdemanella sp.]